MKKHIRNFVSIALAGILMVSFSTTALAEVNPEEEVYEKTTTFYNEENLKVIVPEQADTFYDEESLVSPRIVSTAGWISVTAYPYNTKTQMYNTAHYASYHHPYGRGETAEFKLSQDVQDTFINGGYDAWRVVAEINVKGVKWLEIKADGNSVIIDKNLNNMYSRASYKFFIPVHSYKARAPFVVYYHDSTSQVSYSNGWFVWS